MHHTGTEAVARAQRLWAEGDRREALTALRDRIRIQPDDTEARLVLAGWYREIGAPDQAGRWAIAVPGWTTARERDLAARLVASSGVRAVDAAEFLALPAGPLPAEVQELLLLVEEHRAGVGPRSGRVWRNARRRRMARVLRRGAGAAFAAGMLILGAHLALDGDVPGLALWALFVAVLILIAVMLWAPPERPRLVRGATFLAAGICIAVHIAFLLRV